MYIYIYIYIHTYVFTYSRLRPLMPDPHDERQVGKRDSMYHRLLEVISETATVLESRQKLLYITPSRWWWCIKSLFRQVTSALARTGSRRLGSGWMRARRRESQNLIVSVSLLLLSLLLSLLLLLLLLLCQLDIGRIQL